MSDILKLTREELDRSAVLQDCRAGQLKNSQAAEQLGIRARQVKRLKRMVKLEGVQGLASKKRGRPSNNRLPDETQTHALCRLRADTRP